MVTTYRKLSLISSLKPTPSSQSSIFDKTDALSSQSSTSPFFSPHTVACQSHPLGSVLAAPTFSPFPRAAALDQAHGCGFPPSLPACSAHCSRSLWISLSGISHRHHFPAGDLQASHLRVDLGFLGGLAEPQPPSFSSGGSGQGLVRCFSYQGSASPGHPSRPRLQGEPGL